MSKGKGRLPGGKVDWRETGATVPGFPDKLRARADAIAQEHLDPQQSSKGKRVKQASVKLQRAALK